MRMLWQDIRFAFRTMRKTPTLVLIVLVSLAIGIGANTAVFSVTNALLLQPLHYPQPDRLAILWLRTPGQGITQDWPSPGEYMDIKSQNRVFEDVSLAIGWRFNLTGLSQPERIEGLRTTSSLLRIMGARPLMGRILLPEEDTPGKPATCVISYGLWTRVFGADSHIVGRSLTLNGQQYEVVGVLPRNFVLNNEVIPTVAGIDKVEILVPLPLGADAAQDRRNENFNVLARLKPGVTLKQAQSDIDVIAQHIKEVDKRDPTFMISVVPLLEQVVGGVRRVVLVLLGSVILVLLIACANVANLLLSRAARREKEVALCSALGASRARIWRQLLTESVLLGVLGGAAGLAVASGALSTVRAINPGNIPRLDEISLDTTVLFFTFGISLVTGILFGIAPAYRLSRVELNTVLNAGSRGSFVDGGLGAKRHSFRSLLVMGEFAFSLMLLIGAGLLVRSFMRLQTVSPGFNPANVISIRVSAGARYVEPRSLAQFYENVNERVSHLPGIQAAGAVSVLPFTSSVGWGSMEVEGYTPRPDEPEIQADQRMATPDYFRTLGIPLLKGRFFSDGDAMGSPEVAIIDEKVAQRFWPHSDPIGKHVRPGGPTDPWITIVGVVGSVKQYGLDADSRMAVYYAHKQHPLNSMFLVARSTVDLPTMANTIVRAIHNMDSNVPLYDIGTMQERLYRSMARQRFASSMLGAFAGFAFILALIGIYGVLSHLVTQGTRDIGVRLALGAQKRDILGLVMRQGIIMALVGIAGGILGAVALTRVMQNLLFGIKSIDLLTFLVTTVLLLGVALLACYIPGRRAMRLDPLIALRHE
jgi:putative ABC transport system permease protein